MGNVVDRAVRSYAFMAGKRMKRGFARLLQVIKFKWHQRRHLNLINMLDTI